MFYNTKSKKVWKLLQIAPSSPNTQSNNSRPEGGVEVIVIVYPQGIVYKVKLGYFSRTFSMNIDQFNSKLQPELKQP